MVNSINATVTITKEELACICACIASVLEDKPFKILSVKKNENRWLKTSREMILKDNQMFYRWR